MRIARTLSAFLTKFAIYFDAFIYSLGIYMESVRATLTNREINVKVVDKCRENSMSQAIIKAKFV